MVHFSWTKIPQRIVEKKKRLKKGTILIREGQVLVRCDKTKGPEKLISSKHIF